MIVRSISTEDLKKLPLRAIVALAARCDRRVGSLSLLPDGHEDRDRCRTAIGGAIRLAEDFGEGLTVSGRAIRDPGGRGPVGRSARASYVRKRRWPRSSGRPTRPPPRWKASACATSRRSQHDGNATGEPFPQLANVAADLAARDVFTAAVDAAGAGRLRRRVHRAEPCGIIRPPETRAGPLSEAGQPIDPSPAGPLGML